jgi:SAM-dependent methyltransferase
VINDTPVLLIPEALTHHSHQYDLSDERWSEAYQEMDFYNQEANDPVPPALVEKLERMASTTDFPSVDWLDATYDAAAQLDAFNHLGSFVGQRVAQLGGKGIHAVKSLLAGADEAWLITPMQSEADFGHDLARHIGVRARFKAVVAIAEQLPFDDEVFDSIYAGGCLHHMKTHFAGPEIRRVLTRGGRFAAVDPWQTTLHRVGTRIVGKREANAYCRPLNDERIEPMRIAFGDIDVSHHGPFLRYIALGMVKFTNRELSVRRSLQMFRVDDALPLPTKMGGSIAVLATRH